MGLKKKYLIAYNAASAAAWGVLLYQVAAVANSEGPAAVGLKLDEYTRTTQSFAVMEIVHSLLGVVPAPLFTTAMQVASRLILVWGIAKPFPELNASPCYTSMLVAWSLSEVVRYGYFVLKLTGAVPFALHWLRYSAFLVLYPVGISSECAMMILAFRGPAERLAPWYPWALAGVLASYVPGSCILYTHMLKQRNKYLGATTPGKSAGQTR